MFQIQRVKSAKNIADIFTKPLGAPKFLSQRKRLGLLEYFVSGSVVRTEYSKDRFTSPQGCDNIVKLRIFMIYLINWLNTREIPRNESFPS